MRRMRQAVLVDLLPLGLLDGGVSGRPIVIFTKSGYRFWVVVGAEGVFINMETRDGAWALVWSNTAEPTTIESPFSGDRDA